MHHSYEPRCRYAQGIGLLLRQQHETRKLIFAIDCLGYDQKNLRPKYRKSSQATRHAKNDHTSFNTPQTTYDTCSDMKHHCMSVNESPCIHLVFDRTPPCKPEAWAMNVALGPQKTTRTIYCIALEENHTVSVYHCFWLLQRKPSIWKFQHCTTFEPPRSRALRIQPLRQHSDLRKASLPFAKRYETDLWVSQLLSQLDVA